MQNMKRLIPTVAAAVLAMAVVSCGTKSGESAPALPTTTVLSPDGVQHQNHTFSPDGTRIAYWSPATDSQNWQLWVANADLTSPVKLPVTALAQSPAQWSPDGALLAVGSADFGVSQVVIVPVTGGDVRRVTEGAALSFPMTWFRNGAGLNYFGSAPGGVIRSFVYSLASGEHRPLVPGEKRSHLGVVSPDESRVAYFAIEGSGTTVWVADAAGQNPRQLTTEGFESLEQFQEWSPDGKELLILSRRTGHADLWIVPVDGGKPRQLTRDIRDDFGGAWSEDGKWIAFLSNRGRQTDVWVVPSAGGAEQRVTDTVVDEVGPLAWRPGTGTLTFSVRTQKSGLWALDLADGKERRLTPDAVTVTRFSLSPDASQLLYVIDRAGGIQDLAVAATSGGATRTLLEGGGSVQYPQWSRDGRQIVFTSDRGGSLDVWIVDVAGGAPRQLTNWPGFEGNAVWAHDGSTVYFTADKDSKLNDIWRVPPGGGEPTRVTTNGNINGGITTFAGGPGLFSGTISTKGGQLALSRFRPDGTSNIVWDRSSALWTLPSRSGDAILAEVEQPDGKVRTMILKADGSGGRAILAPGQSAQWWSTDGKWVVYGLAAGGANDLGLLHVPDGVTRRLTTTPQDEQGAELTPDGKTVLFRRVETVQRITTVDLSKLLAAAK
jgi:Tol biopolymer transport system component